MQEGKYIYKVTKTLISGKINATQEINLMYNM